MGKFINLTGSKFGRLTVLERNTKKSILAHKVIWKCKCECGKVAFVSACHLLSGHTQSCGCIHTEQIRRRLTTQDGLCGTPLYKLWRLTERSSRLLQ